MFYVVQYRCQYRDYWYDHADLPDLPSALHVAQQLMGATGRHVRVVSTSGTVMWSSLPVAQNGFQRGLVPMFR